MINLTKQDTINMWSDITKFLTIAIIMHLLLYIVDDYGDLFSEFTLKIFLYLTIGLIVYHLIIKNIIDKYIFDEPVKSKKNEKKHKKKNNRYNKIQSTQENGSELSIATVSEK